MQLRDKLVEEGHLDSLLRVVPERDPELYCFMLAIFFGLLCRPPPLNTEAILHPDPATLPLPTPDWEAVMHLQVGSIEERARCSGLVAVETQSRPEVCFANQDLEAMGTKLDSFTHDFESIR